MQPFFPLFAFASTYDNYVYPAGRLTLSSTNFVVTGTVNVYVSPLYETDSGALAPLNTGPAML